MPTAWRVVNPDFTSSRGFRWPFPGSKVVLPEPEQGFTLGEPCPQFEGDGVCLAKTFRGAASGGMPAIVGLEVSYRNRDVLGEDADKLRVKACKVVEVFDVQALVRAGFCKYLYGANLRGADLRGANLRGADLRGAYLDGADLRGADLDGAYLDGAYLRGAYLDGANLRGAYLRGAYLDGADLRGAYLDGANADRYTRWPVGFDAAARGVTIR